MLQCRTVRNIQRVRSLTMLLLSTEECADTVVNDGAVSWLRGFQQQREASSTSLSPCGGHNSGARGHEYSREHSTGSCIAQFPPKKRF